LFIGTYEHSIDEKGRLAIPARFRSELSDGLFLTRGIDRCLIILTPESWQKLADRIATLPMFQNDARQLQRHFFSGATSLQADRLGRVLIPQFLRDYAGLSGEVVVAGILSRIEIWDRTVWESERAEAEEHSQELAEHLAATLGSL
jgi:MraZ protein